MRSRSYQVRPCCCHAITCAAEGEGLAGAGDALGGAGEEEGEGEGCGEAVLFGKIVVLDAEPGAASWLLLL